MVGYPSDSLASGCSSCVQQLNVMGSFRSTNVYHVNNIVDIHRIQFVVLYHNIVEPAYYSGVA